MFNPIRRNRLMEKMTVPQSRNSKSATRQDGTTAQVLLYLTPFPLLRTTPAG
jgi:hypothetical protein